MKKDKLDDKYFVGFLLILLAFVGCVISFYLVIYAIPVYIIGFLLVFFSEKTMKQKLWTTIPPLLLWIPATYLFLSIYNYSTPKILLIPTHYEGVLRIVYQEDCGIKPATENGKQVLVFPKNGILILKNDFDTKVNNDYFLIDEQGNRTKIRQAENNEKRKDSAPLVSVSGAGTFRKTLLTKEIVFADYYISYKDSVATEHYVGTEKFNTFADSLVNDCRGKRH